MANHIKRRKFLATLGVVAVWPLAARAQQRKIPTIGALVIGNISPEEFWREFRQGLRDLGYVEGQNIRFEFRSAEGHLDRLPELAAELVRLKHAHRSGGTASDARNPNRHGRDRRPDWYGAGREPSSARRKRYRPSFRDRRIGWQMCPTDP